MASPRPNLPLEVWAMVIKNCACLSTSSPTRQISNEYIRQTIAIRRTTLLACALTCTSWLPTSLQCLYRVVLITQFDTIEPDDTLGELGQLEKLAHGISKLRSLRPTSSRGDLPLRLCLSSYEPLINVFNLSVEDSGSDTLEILFPEYERLKIPQIAQSSNMIAFEPAPPALRARLCIRALQELHIYSAVFESFRSLFVIIGAFPSLRHLSLKLIQIVVKVPLVLFDRGQFPSANLLKLSVFDCDLCVDELYVILQWMLLQNVLSHGLVDLNIEITEPSFSFNGDKLEKVKTDVKGWIAEVVYNARGSLKYLDLWFDCGDVDDSPALDLRANRSLKAFSPIGHLGVQTLVSTLTSIRSQMSVLSIKGVYPKTFHEIDLLVDALINPDISKSLDKLELLIYISDLEVRPDSRNEFGGMGNEEGPVDIVRCRRLNRVYGERLALWIAL